MIPQFYYGLLLSYPKKVNFPSFCSDAKVWDKKSLKRNIEKILNTA